MTPPYEKSENPIEGAALLRLAFSARGELDEPNFRAIYRGVIDDLGLSDEQVREYIRAHKEELVEKLRVMRPVRSGS